MVVGDLLNVLCRFDRLLLFFFRPDDIDDELCSATFTDITGNDCDGTRDEFYNVGRLTVTSLVNDMQAAVFSCNFTSEVARRARLCIKAL